MNRARRSQPPYFDHRPRPPSARGWELYHPWRHYPASGTAASRDRLIAHHEAGHAIAYVEFDVPFKKVWLEYPKTGRGFVEPAGDVFIPTPAALEEDAVIALAGPFAQRRFAPRSHWRLTAGYQGEINGREIFAPPGSDLSIFWSDIGALVDHGRRREAIVEKIEARTLALVKERWQEIRLIAAALLERKTLTERAVYRLLKRPLPKRAPRCSVIVICSVLVVC